MISGIIHMGIGRPSERAYSLRFSPIPQAWQWLPIMDYSKIYRDLISSRTHAATDSTILEKHHILPRSLGGGDEKQNIVRLTPREHFVAHRLLAKIHGGKMWAALAYMTRGRVKSASGVKVTSRVYALAKQKDAEWRSEHYTKNNPWRGKRFSSCQLEKMRGPRPSIAGKNHPFYGVSRPDTGAAISFVKTFSINDRIDVDLSVMRRIEHECMLVARAGYGEAMRKLSMFYRGQDLGASRSGKMQGKNNPNFGNGAAIAGSKNPMHGKSHSAETKRKISEKAKRTIQCPHCSTVGNIANMKRWHFDKCRNNSAH